MTETRERRLWWRHLLSFLVPGIVTLVIPAVIVMCADVSPPDLGSPLLSGGLTSVGGLLIAGGLGLLIWTVFLFDRVGKGTLGVGNVMGEPVNLVVQGPYRHVRKPMISGVLGILLGEVAITASGWLLLWFAIFFTSQALHIQLWEEPHLVRRYGDEYLTYRRNVPRWIPRLSGWEPSVV